LENRGFREAQEDQQGGGIVMGPLKRIGQRKGKGKAEEGASERRSNSRGNLDREISGLGKIEFQTKKRSP